MRRLFRHRVGYPLSVVLVVTVLIYGNKLAYYALYLCFKGFFTRMDLQLNKEAGPMMRVWSMEEALNFGSNKFLNFFKWKIAGFAKLSEIVVC